MEKKKNRNEGEMKKNVYLQNCELRSYQIVIYY